MNDIKRASGIDPRLDQDRGLLAKRLAARFAFANRQPFFATEPSDTVAAQSFTLAAEQDNQPSVTEGQMILAGVHHRAPIRWQDGPRAPGAQRNGVVLGNT